MYKIASYFLLPESFYDQSFLDHFVHTLGELVTHGNSLFLLVEQSTDTNSPKCKNYSVWFEIYSMFLAPTLNSFLSYLKFP